MSPSGYTITFKYDGSDRIIEARDHEGYVRKYSYDADGYLEKVKDAEIVRDEIFWQLPRRFDCVIDVFLFDRQGPASKDCHSERNQSLTDFLTPLSSGGRMENVGQSAYVRAQPLIAVRNVRESSRWYSQLLGFDSLPEHPHREVYDRMQYRGELILQLHAWDEEAHPNLVNADTAPPGHGVLLWFEVSDFHEIVERARASHAQVILEPHINPNPKHREMWLRDPDGYVVVIASPDGAVSS